MKKPEADGSGLPRIPVCESKADMQQEDLQRKLDWLESTDLQNRVYYQQERDAENMEANWHDSRPGFGTGGATLEDVILMKQHVGPNVKIKAAGGIRSKEDMELYIGAGCSRIGTSSAIAMLQDGE